jgi:hypothetical protein
VYPFLAVQHLQHLKRNQSSLLAELERMMNENEQLRKYVALIFCIISTPFTKNVFTF